MDDIDKKAIQFASQIYDMARDEVIRELIDGELDVVIYNNNIHLRFFGERTLNVPMVDAVKNGLKMNAGDEDLKCTNAMIASLQESLQLVTDFRKTLKLSRGLDD